MNRTEVYKTPQFAATLLGLWFILAGIVGLINTNNHIQGQSINGPSSNNQLQVKPAFQQPTSTIDNLQGARSLQGQLNSNLQESDNLNNLQPNARQSDLPSTNILQ
jgi:hypothetical protein